jgi:hypothetical protein
MHLTGITMRCLLTLAAISSTCIATAGAATLARSTEHADAAASTSVLFAGSSLSGWIEQAASTNRIRTVADPAGGPDQVLEFTADNGDIAPLTPTDNPRAQLITPNGIVRANQPFWESYELYLPPSFPAKLTNGSWVTFGSPFYGPPFNGTPSIDLEVTNGHFLWQANANAPHPWQVLWEAPVVTGHWIRFTWFVNPAASGFVELYVDDVPVSVNNGSTTTLGTNLPVLDASNDLGPWCSQLSVYMQHNVFSSVTAYFRDFAIGTTQAAADAG